MSTPTTLFGRTLLCVVFLVLIALAVVFKWKSCYTKKQTASTIEQVVDNKQDPAKKWVDPGQREHAEKLVPEADMSLIRAAYSREIDSLTGILRIQEKQILAFTSIATTGTGSVVPSVNTVISGDTCRSDFSYEDRWISLSGIIGPAPVINYQVRDSLAITTYSDRRGLFSSPRTYVDVFSLNPRVTVSGLSGFRVPVKQPGRIGIGPFLGYGYSFGKWSPVVGFSLHYSLIRF